MAEAEHVSVLMLDIQGSTPLVKQMGGEKYLFSLLPNFHETINRKIEERNARTFQEQAELGDDCVKAVFDTPRDAVACAIDIQNQFKQYGVAKNADGSEISIVLHLAIHTCRTLTDGSPDRAEIPDLARLLKEAHNGQILLSQECFTAYKNYMAGQGMQPRTCEQFGGYLFKGIAGEQSIYSLKYDEEYRGAPGTQFIGFANVEAANEYIVRVETEKAMRDKFMEAVGGRGGKIRFVTIHGEGGMGKTRLSINCARQMAGRFPGGIVFVPLAEILTPTVEAVAEAVYTALQLTKAPDDDLVKKLPLHLKNRMATLILLDNAESITHVDAIVAYIQTLLERVPQLCFLASSQKWFGLGYQEGCVDVNDGLTPWEAYQLVSERVQQRRFALPEAVSAEEIAELDARLRQTLDYTLPKDTPASGREHDLLCLLRLFRLANRNSLALEIIATWVGIYSTPDELLAVYEEEALGLLTESDDSPYANQERQKSLTAVYLRSWRNLGKEKNGGDAQIAFLVAALFADTFSRESIKAVLGWDERRIAYALKTVHDAALFRTVASAMGTRYRMHWQLQQFGRDEKYWKGSTKNESNLPALAVLRQSIIAYYDKKTREYENNEGIKTAEGRAWLESEWRNVVAAADNADKEAKLEEAVWLRLRLTRYFELTSKWGVWEAVGKKAKESAVQAGDKRNQPATLNNLGLVYQAQSKWAEAEAAYNQSLAIFKEFGDRHRQGQTLGNLAILWIKQGYFDTAAKYAREGIAAMEQTQDTRLLQWLRQILADCIAQGGAA